MDTFLNWVWQGSLVALATQASLRLLAHSRAAHRYTLCAAALMTVLVLPVLPVLTAAAVSASLSPTASGTTGPVLALPAAWWTSCVPLIGLWMLWTALHAIRMAVSFRALRTVRGRCLPFPAAVESRLRGWCGVRPGGRAARLVLSPDVASAAALGGRVPAIAVAPALVDRLADDDLDRVVMHEWAHVQRRDDLLTLIHLCARALAGWHPAIWWLERQMRIEREAACDEIVVAAIGGPKAYAASLAAVASVTATRARSLPAPGVLDASALRLRVTRILAQHRLARPARSWVGVSAAALLLAPIASVVAGFPAIAITSPQALGSRDQIPATADGALEPSPARHLPPVTTVDARNTSAPAPPERQSRRRATAARRAVFATVASRVQPLMPTAAAAEPSRRLSPGIVATAPAAPRGLPARPTAPVERPDAADDGRAWRKVVDGGARVGRGPARAATATAGAFSRLGRRIADTF